MSRNLPTLREMPTGSRKRAQVRDGGRNRVSEVSVSRADLVLEYQLDPAFSVILFSPFVWIS